MAYKTRLGGSEATFAKMMEHFGVLTVMNAKVYSLPESFDQDPYTIVKGLQTPLCELKTLKVANVTIEGPSKTVTGGQFSNPLIKFGKTARLEMQDALGNAKALDVLGGGVVETETESITGLHFGEDFNGPVTIVGDSFFIDSATGEQVDVKIVFYQFLPDSIFNLVQDAEGDATVFDMNGDLLTTVIKLGNKEGTGNVSHGVFYSILDPAKCAIV